MAEKLELGREEAHALEIARRGLLVQHGGSVQIGRAVLCDILSAVDRAMTGSLRLAESEIRTEEGNGGIFCPDFEPLGKYQGKMIPQHPRTWARIQELSRFELEFALLDYVARDHEDAFESDDWDATALEILRVTLETNRE